MLTRMLDTDMSIYVMRGRAKGLAETFNALAEELCISTITLGDYTMASSGHDRWRATCRRYGTSLPISRCCPLMSARLYTTARSGPSLRL